MKIIDETTKNSIEIIEENGDIYFIHPMTGQRCESIHQALTGFSEQDQECNAGWDRIRDAVMNDMERISEHLNQDCDICYVSV